jgi:hypothetical protein
VSETVDAPSPAPAPRRPGRPRTNHDARRAEIVDVAARLFAQRAIRPFALASALIHDIADYRDQVTVALHEWRTIVASDDRERVARVRRARREFEQVVARAMQRGKAEGMFAFEQPRLAVLGFLGMINYAYQWYRPDVPYEPDELAAAFSDFFIDGVRVR